MRGLLTQLLLLKNYYYFEVLHKAGLEFVKFLLCM